MADSSRVSLGPKPLPTNDLRRYSGGMEFVDRVRLRIKEEMQRQHLSQRDVAGILGGWSQSRVAKILTGRVKMTVEDLGSLCFAVGISPAEAVRDRGLEFCAEMTPTELRILERLRELPTPVYEAVKTLIQITPQSIEKRGATKRKPLLGPPRM